MGCIRLSEKSEQARRLLQLNAEGINKKLMIKTYKIKNKAGNNVKFKKNKILVEFNLNEQHLHLLLKRDLDDLDTSMMMLLNR